MQAHTLWLSQIEIPTMVGNFELKTLSRGGEVWIEISSQGLGGLTPNICFWSKSLPYPMPPPPSGITLITAEYPATESPFTKVMDMSLLFPISNFFS